MTFAPPFSRTFQPTFDRRNAGGAWWNLFGAIPLANCVAAYQPKGAANLAASYTNLTGNATYNAALGDAPAWDAVNGWKPNGSSNFLKTGITVDSVNWSVVIRLSNVTSGAVVPFGAIDSSDRRFTILPNLVNVIYYQYGVATTGWLTKASAFSSGVLGMANNKGFRNGVQETGTISSVSVCTQPLYLCARNNIGTADAFSAAYIQAFAIYNNDQAANMAALTTQINLL